MAFRFCLLSAFTSLYSTTESYRLNRLELSRCLMRRRIFGCVTFVASRPTLLVVGPLDQNFTFIFMYVRFGVLHHQYYSGCLDLYGWKMQRIRDKYANTLKSLGIEYGYETGDGGGEIQRWDEMWFRDCFPRLFHKGNETMKNKRSTFPPDALRWMFASLARRALFPACRRWHDRGPCDRCPCDRCPCDRCPCDRGPCDRCLWERAIRKESVEFPQAEQCILRSNYPLLRAS